MKQTVYFTHTRTRPDRIVIKDNWILDTIKSPCHAETQNDGRIRKWMWIKEEEKYLRVVLLDDGETVHNAFFDSDFKLD
jgi:hypothetical protein